MIAQMIGSIMYFGIGFLLAALSVLIVAPLIHDRVVRLTMRRLEATIPLSMAELQADKDLQRAEFAMSTRRLETTIEQLKTNSAGQLAELSRKGDAINRLKIELSAVRDQLSATEDEIVESMVRWGGRLIVATRVDSFPRRSLLKRQLTFHPSAEYRAGGVEVAHHSERGAQANTVARAALSVTGDRR